jgi:hypothetical protein
VIQDLPTSSDDFQAVTWQSLQPDQIRGIGLSLVLELEVLKLRQVLELAQQTALAAQLSPDDAELDQLKVLMDVNRAAIRTYDVRIRAVLGAIPPDAES